MYFAEIEKVWALVCRENMTDKEEWEPVYLYDVLRAGTNLEPFDTDCEDYALLPCRRPLVYIDMCNFVRMECRKALFYDASAVDSNSCGRILSQFLDLRPARCVDMDSLVSASRINVVSDRVSRCPCMIGLHNAQLRRHSMKTLTSLMKNPRLPPLAHISTRNIPMWRIAMLKNQTLWQGDE